MTAENFTYLLQHPEKINSEETNAVSNITEQFPYFQPAHALYLRGLKNKESFKYNQQLKTTASITTDRSVLFDFITSEIFNQNEISEQIKRNSEQIKNITVFEVEDISVEKSVTIDDALKQHIQASEGVLDPYLFETKKEKITESNPIISVDVSEIEEVENTLNIGKPLEFDKTETHSFTEWLKITSFKPIERDEVRSTSEKTDETSLPITKKMALIDKFLLNNPKIEPVKTAPVKPIVLADHNKSDGFMTETLARVYLEQKNYDKAMQSYKILSLKYPEKSGFFADQIKKVKELQEKNNL
ncbi:hypothetical protein [Paucihalobacter sp.]|uniref:hypothetical protein n=1 Tax=Paucihalobacter sp. TaxID=2850405 RepID=UPI002FE35B78